jgi:hypothetical protein
MRQFQDQIRELSTEVKSLRTEEQTAREEAKELRKELDVTNAKLALLMAGANRSSDLLPTAALLPSKLSPSQEAPSQDLDRRVTALEESQQLADAKINEQSQTKVESGSKYRLRLSGIVLMNLFANRGTVDNQDFPQIASPGSYANTFGGSLRQSQIGLQTFGPTIAGAHTSANLRFDFAGGFPAAPNGVTEGLVRLRTGTVRLDWTNTSIVAGQDSLFFVPLSPTSLASLAIPPLSYAGNLWSWTPQVRIEHRFVLSDSSSFLLQGGILDSLSGELPQASYDRLPTWGERSGQPAYATRISWSHGAFGQNFTMGLGGYYGRQDWGFDREVDSWAGTVDLLLPLGKFLAFSGEFYRGKATGGLGGGIGQSVLWNGPLSNPNTAVYGLNSMGGWAQLKIKLTPKLEVNGALGDDNPFASQLHLFNANSGYLAVAGALSRNLSPFINFIYQPRSDFAFSLEYRRLKTYTLNSNSATANHIDLSLGYIF